MIDDVALNFSPNSLLLLNGILAVVMFPVAIDLMPDDFHWLLRAPKPVLVGLFSQFVVLPVLTFLLILLITPHASIALGLILVAACPGGNISNFITQRAGENAALSVSMTAIATVAVIFLTPLNIALWGLLNAKRPALTARLRKPLQWLSMGVIWRLSRWRLRRTGATLLILQALLRVL